VNWTFYCLFTADHWLASVRAKLRQSSDLQLHVAEFSSSRARRLVSMPSLLSSRPRRRRLQNR